MSFRLRTICTLILVTLFISITSAQESCNTIVQAAIDTVAETCDSLRRNEACYGNVTIDAEAAPDSDNFSFETAGDIVNVADLASMRLTSQVAETGDWGIAMMYVQANIAEDMSENVQFVLFGDVELENAGFDGDVPQIATAPERLAPVIEIGGQAETTEPTSEPTATPQPTLLPITSTANLNVRSGASTSNGIVGTLANGATVQADARNDAGDWVRITLDDGIIGWVYVPLVTIDGDVFTLDLASENSNGNSDTTTDTASPSTEEYERLTGNDLIQTEIPLDDYNKIFLVQAQAGQELTVIARSLDDTLEVNVSLRDVESAYVAGGSRGTQSEITSFKIQEDGEYRIVVESDSSRSQAQAVELDLYLTPVPEIGQTNAFILRLGTSETTEDCAEVPDSGILVQTPSGLGQISLLINEVVIDLGSTAYIRTEDDAMTVGIIEGAGRITTTEGEIIAPVGTLARVTFNSNDPSTGISDIEVDLLDEELASLLPIELLDREFVFQQNIVDVCANQGTIITNTGANYDRISSTMPGIQFFVRAGDTVTFTNDGGTDVSDFSEPIMLRPLFFFDGRVNFDTNSIIVDSQAQRDLTHTFSENTLFAIHYSITENDGDVTINAVCS